ncbi:thermonuclease family protein [Sphingobium sp. YC-XJ3]|uniref:thermonuclease family protein n=1 Tax=Sphingobium sp. YC-XJ3 TaxID=3024245 RepID=UPI0023619226|nr:thermonuclease family protein [Sphingobium sp. YC-XJ3]WDA39324.1 thermonuclease family protein [Sphingobium sp. YC-XJ3]
MKASIAAPVESGRVVRVTDGDTFRLESGERVRIAGIDAAETQPGNAKCAIELVRGKAATERTIALLDNRMLTLERVGRSYKRTVARVRLDGRDVATMLVEMGIARWWPRGHSKPDWCGR